MSEKKSLLDLEYQKILTQILSVAQKNSRLWDDPAYISGALPLLSVWICEQDDDKRYYGITKSKITGKLVFCFSDGKGGYNPLTSKESGKITSFTTNISKLTKELERYSGIDLKSSFLSEIEAPIRRYEMLNAGVDEKVRRKLRKLETELTH